MAIGLFASLFVVVLVIVFCLIKRLRRNYFCDDIEPLFLKNLYELKRCFLLLFCQVKDGRAILRSIIWSLVVFLCWVMNLKEVFCDLLVACFFRVKNHLNSFCLTSCTSANLFISWVYNRASSISRGYLDHAWKRL